MFTSSSFPQLAPLPGLTPVMGGPDPLISIPTDLVAAPGATVWVPVNLQESEGIESVDIALAYDTSRLEVLSPAEYGSYIATLRCDTCRVVFEVRYFGKGPEEVVIQALRLLLYLFQRDEAVQYLRAG